MSKEITITNANNFYSFISFRINGLKDGITVGIVPDPNSHGRALSIAYKGETKIVPFNATTNYINELNEKDTNIISSYIKRYNKDLTKRNGYGIDYCDVFDIEEGCIYSVWCGDPQGLLFLFDKCMIIPSKIVKNDDNFEFEQAVKFWEQNKDKYLNFLTWRDKNLTKWEEDGKIYYGGYQEDYSKFDSIPLYENEKKEDDKITTTLTMDKETYDWLTTPSEEDDIGYWQPDQVTELDDETFDAFEKEVMNPEPDMEKVEAAKNIFKSIEKVSVDAKTYPLKNQEVWMHEPVVLQNPEDFWKHERTHYREPHLLELMDEWGVNGSNYADFRSVIQEYCFDKGLYAFDDIEKSWKEHQESIKNVVKSIKKNGNN